MFAIFRKDGKQFRVTKGDTIRLDRIKSEPGSVFETDEVLAISEKKGELKFGEPIVKNAKVIGKIIRHGKDKKIVVFKRKRRKTYRRKYGHRQLHTMVQIEEITSKSKSEKNIKTEKVLPKKETTKKTQQKKETTLNSSNKNIPKKRSVKN